MLSIMFDCNTSRHAGRYITFEMLAVSMVRWYSMENLLGMPGTFVIFLKQPVSCYGMPKTFNSTQYVGQHDISSSMPKTFNPTQ